MSTTNGLLMRRPLVFILSTLLLFLAGSLVWAEVGGGELKSQSASRLEEVQTAFESGDLSGALSLLNAILSVDKDNAEAHAKTGVILVRMGRFHEGVEHLKRSIELAPENIEYYKSLAYSYEFRLQYDDAIRIFQQIRELSVPDSKDHQEAVKKIEFLTATKLARGGQVDKALPIFSQLIQKYPDDYLIRYSLGLSYFFLRKMDEAQVEFERVVEINPRYANAYLNLASIYERKGEISKAIENLETAANLGANSAIGKRAQERLGIIEANLIASSGNHQDALDILKDVVAINPNSLPALMLIARSNTQLGRYKLAEESYQKILSIAPNHLEAKSQLAGLYLLSKQTGLAVDLLEEIIKEGKGTRYATEAEKTLMDISGEGMSGDEVFEKMSETEKAEVIEAFLLERIENNPKDIDAYFKLAQLYMQAKRKEEAYEAISTAAELSPENLKIIGIKAAIASDIGKLDDAISAYAKGVMLSADPEQAAAMVRSLRLAVAKKSFNEGALGIAEREFKEMIAERPDNVLAYYYLGLIYSREEAFLKAVDSYENVVRLSPSNFGARLNLAGTLERLNQEEDAISEYRKILQDNPSEEMANDVKARLFAAEKKIKGLTASMGYSITSDDNTIADDTIANSGAELRSDMSFNLSYQ
ncbi:MAG TPA: tetratricopeptide repeat protein, partial [Gammaproteobacteria bacterium]|nr:tetratricopeptide repeat protein [Gammaproteobacteria bacterium]